MRLRLRRAAKEALEGEPNSDPPVSLSHPTPSRGLTTSMPQSLKILHVARRQALFLLAFRLANVRHVMHLVPRIGCDAYEFNTETLVDQEPHGG